MFVKLFNLLEKQYVNAYKKVSENLRITQREALQKLQNGQDDNEPILSFDFVQWKTQGQKMKEMEELMSKLREKKSSGEEVDTETLTNLIEEQQLDKYGVNNDEIGKANASAIPIHWHDILYFNKTF